MALDPIKTRDLPFEAGGWSDRLLYQGSQISSNTGTFSIVGRQTTTSWNNTDWLAQKALDRRLRNGTASPFTRRTREWISKQDHGSPFQSISHEYSDDTRIIKGANVQPAWDYQWSGPWFAKSHNVGPTSSLWPQVSLVNMSNDMLRLGTTAIAETIPTNPVAGAAQFLGELRERVPSVPGAQLARRGGDPKAIADEYLNYEFGLKPFIKDIREIGSAVKSAEKRLAQLRADSGRLVRRRYKFPVIRTVSDPVVQSTNGFGSPAWRTGSTGAYTTGGKLTVTTSRETETWFSGAYTYLYAEGDSTLSRLKRAEQGANAVLGLRLTPELIWQLTPWSWAVDWVGNLGDVIHNLSAFSNDGLVMRWGYVMQTVRLTHTYHLSGVNFHAGGRASTTQSFTTVVKKRVKATPYGFGLDTDAFTTRQWAILGALGVSRTHGKL